MSEHIPERWLAALRKSDLFGRLDETAFERLGFEERVFDKGQVVLRQGDPANDLFVVVEGLLEIVLPGDRTVVRRIGPGGTLGEIALVLGGERTADAYAVLPTCVLALGRETFENVLAEHPAIGAPLTRLLAERMRRDKVAGFLRHLFGNLEPEEVDAIEKQVAWSQLASGQELFRAGEAATAAYIVAVGRLRAVVPTSDGERVAEELGPGQWVGEMDLLSGSVHTSTVYALRDTELMVLSAEVFDRLVADHPHALRETTRAFVRRLQTGTIASAANESGAGPRARTKTLAVLPTTGSAAAAAFVQRLVEELGRHGATRHLTAASVDEQLGKAGISAVPVDHPANLRLSSWLLEQEERHAFTVYEAGAEWSPWTERSLRYADHVLLVAEGRDPPAPGKIEQQLAALFARGRAPRHSLVLLHETSEPVFPRTDRWLVQRKVDQHFHVRTRVKDDVARLVRLVTERAVCVVLGGGGSRGYAHVGFLRALEELAIPVDAIGGTSIGALVATAHARGLDWRRMLAELPAALTRIFANVTLPVVSLLSAKVEMELLEELVGDLQVEDMATPLFSISTNLTRGGEVVHRTGSAAIAVRASTSIPGMFPPVPWNNDFLVDGGISNNVPVDTMASYFQGSILAVDVMPEVGLEGSANLPMALSGWAAARQRLGRFQNKEQAQMPDILNVLFRSASAASKSLERAERSASIAALYLRPTVSRWNIADFRNARPVAEEGYSGTVPALRAWWPEHRRRILGA